MSARNSRSAIARDTLRICDAGSFELNGQTFAIADEIAFARDNSETLRPADLNQLVASQLADDDDDDDNDNGNDATPTVIEFVEETTLQGLFRCEMRRNGGDPPVAVLNFASAKNPGGGFLGGASAQEESLARSSALFRCIERNAMYGINRSNNRQLVYNDVAIYSPSVPFFKDDDGALREPVLAAVLTMPAPNGGCLKRGIAPADLQAVIDRRVCAILAMAAAHGHTCLVLGAWGCGVFRNDVSMMASAFRRALADFEGRFRHVSFSITGENFALFRAAFEAAPSAAPAAQRQRVVAFEPLTSK
jgi:uncharacterized protein (TIGR02452 family)